MSSNVIDVQEEIIKGLLGIDTELLTKGIQYGLMINQGLIDMIAPSIELITGIDMLTWKEGVSSSVNRWIYQFDWLVPDGYSICIDHRNRLNNMNALRRCVNVKEHHKFYWDLCGWYYPILEHKGKCILVTSNKDVHLDREIEWLEKGIGYDIKVLELPNVNSLNTLFKHYQVGIYESLQIGDKAKVRSNVMYYLSHVHLIDRFNNNKLLNISTLSKY